MIFSINENKAYNVLKIIILFVRELEMGFNKLFFLIMLKLYMRSV